MNRSKLNLWLASLFILIPLIGVSIYLLKTTVPKERKAAKGSPPTQWYAYPRTFEGSATVGTIDPTESSRSYPVFSSRYGRVACYLSHGVKVKLIKKWWSRYEKRFYFKVTDGACTGWLAGESLALNPEPDQETHLDQSGDAPVPDEGLR